MRALLGIALLIAVQHIAAKALPHETANEEASIHVVVDSPVPLTFTENRKMKAAIRDLGWVNADEVVRQLFQDKGYFRAEVVSVKSATINANTLILRVTPGKKYHLLSVSWLGNNAFSESELANLIPIRPGELYNRTKMLAGLNAARKLYQSRGYINYICVPTPKMDDEAATISFEMDVDEGEQFRFGQLEVAGMERAHRETLLSAWQDLHGRPYNPADANEFFKRYFRSPRPNIKPEDYLTRKIDEVDHSVDYSLEVVPWLRYRVRGNSLDLVKKP